MEGRRVRRFGVRTRTPLLLHTIPTRRPTNTISCWYCDFKIFALNEPLFRFGRRHASFFRLWFSIGIGFGLTALLVVSAILLWELARTLHLFYINTEPGDIASGFLFGFVPSISGWSVSLADAAYLFTSTIISVSLHEVGHALAAASEGIQMEYVAVFVAVLFPGALVALSSELLQALSRFSGLRVYCAGIWHNAIICAVCGFALFILPFILFPFFTYGDSPMVLDVRATSPLSTYLSPGDVIVALDGLRIHDAHEWMELTSLMNEQLPQNLNRPRSHYESRPVGGRKGYCVPNSVIEESDRIQSLNNHSACPDYLTTLQAIDCSDPSKMVNISSQGTHLNRESKYCLNAKDIVKLNKCGEGWATILSNGSSCPCLQDESCLSPIQFPGLTWVEITYASPYAPECLQLGRSSFPVSSTSDLKEHNCSGTFVFVGDVISMAHSVQLTSYQPRWSFPFSACLPNMLERSLMCTLKVSLTLVLLNSLPVYFLDGESILEMTLCHFTSLSPGKRAKVLQACLLGGTLISILTLLRIFFFNLL